LAVSPGEIIVGLRKAELRQAIKNLGPGKSLGKEDELRMLFLQFRDAPFPKWKCLGMRVIDTEDSYSLLYPIFKNALQLQPEALPCRRFKIERINVLVFFRR